MTKKLAQFGVNTKEKETTRQESCDWEGYGVGAEKDCDVQVLGESERKDYTLKCVIEYGLPERS